MAYNREFLGKHVLIVSGIVRSAKRTALQPVLRGTDYEATIDGSRWHVVLQLERKIVREKAEQEALREAKLRGRKSNAP